MIDAETASSPTVAGGRDLGASRVRIVWTALAASLVIIALAAGYVLYRDRAWIASSDLAFFELALRRMPGDLPMVGVYSRFGWSHPGPFLYYFLWGPWKALGGVSVGLLAGMLVLHLVSLALAWFTARSRSTAAAVLVTAGLLLVWATGASSDALMPWNPQVSLLMGGTLLIAAWDASTRGRWGAALLLPVSTVLVQSHLGTALLVIAVVGVAVALGLVPRGQSSPIPWRTWVASALVTAVLWVPPLIEQFSTGGGNLTRILSTGAAPGIGYREAVATLTHAFAVPPYWWSPTFKILPDVLVVPVLALLPLAALVVALVRRDGVQLRFLAVAAAALAAVVLTVARLDQGFMYLVAWIPAVVVVILAVSVWILVAAWDRERWIVILSPVLLVVPALGVAWNMVSNPPPLIESASQVSAALEAVERSGDASRGVHLSADPWDGPGVFETVPAIALALEQRGIAVSAEFPDYLHPELRALLPAEPDGRAPLLLRTPEGPDDPPPAGWQVVAEDIPFTADEWAQMARFQAAAADPSLTEDERRLTLLGYEGVRDGRIAWQILMRR